jgi:hypothetical protein
MHVRSLLTRALCATVVLAALTTAGHSAALDRELTEAPDFRVRVQAALRLGRSGPSARGDLEQGLRDPHPAVRVACAVGLGRVADLAALPALEQAARQESFASARSAMQEAIERIKAARAPKEADSADPGMVDRAKYVVQLGAMRNESGVRPGDLDGVMRQAAKSKASSIKGAVVVDNADAAIVRRATEKRIPVLLVDGNLTRLTQTSARDGAVVVSAQVSMSVRKVPQQTLKGMVNGNAAASGNAGGRTLDELQNRAVNAAVQSAMGSVGAEIASLAK